MDSFRLGGAERQAIMLAQGLAASYQVSVKVIALRGSGVVSEVLNKRNIPTQNLWSNVRNHLAQYHWRGWFALLWVTYRLRKERADIIIPFAYYPNVVVNLLGKITGIPVRWWNQRDGGIFFSGGWLEDRALRNVTNFVSNSTEGAQYLAENHEIDSRRIAIIRNGVQLDNPREDWRERLSLNKSHFVVTMVANLHQNKDHETLLYAWHKFLTAIVSSTPILLLAGRKDSTYQSLVHLANTLHINESVRFLGAVSDVSGLLASSDVGVLSSRQEGCPNSILECMAARLPVVATNITGCREALGDDYPFLFPVGDALMMANHLHTFSESEKQRNEAGNQNYQRIQNYFSPENMVSHYARLLNLSERWS